MLLLLFSVLLDFDMNFFFFFFLNLYSHFGFGYICLFDGDKIFILLKLLIAVGRVWLGVVGWRECVCVFDEWWWFVK